MPVFGRLVTAMATPFTSELELDLDGAVKLAEHVVQHGTETVLLAGTTGESPTLHDDELWRMLAAVRAAVGDRAKVIVGTGTNDTSKTVAATSRAAEEGAHGILVVTPYYNKPSQRALFHHFTEVAAATDLPVLLYDIPGRTSREIELETLIRLSEIDNIVGVKDAVGDLAKTAEVVAGTQGAPGGFEVYCGADEINLPMLAVGAVGFVSVAAHLAGDQLADMANVFESDPTKAREIHQRLLPLCRALFLEPSPGPLKAALDHLGLPGGALRPPMIEAEDATREALVSALAHAGIDA